MTIDGVLATGFALFFDAIAKIKIDLCPLSSFSSTNVTRLWVGLPEISIQCLS